MKFIFPSVMLSMSAASLSFISAPAFAGITENVPVAIQTVFVPTKGYDDNDSVEIVLDGQLPDSCYSVEKSVVTQDPNDKMTFKVEQRAVKYTDGLCLQGGTMPAHMMMTVPFTTEVMLGRLDAGTYKISFNNGKSQAVTSFTVGKATSPSIDSLPYAQVSNAMISDLVVKNNNVVVTLSGTLNSSCMHLNDKTPVPPQKVGDVVVVRPTVTIDANPVCLQMIRNFSTQIDLGKMEPGRYLAHIRSHNGKSVNRVFSVVDKED